MWKALEAIQKPTDVFLRPIPILLEALVVRPQFPGLQDGAPLAPRSVEGEYGLQQ